MKTGSKGHTLPPSVMLICLGQAHNASPWFGAGRQDPHSHHGPTFNPPFPIGRYIPVSFEVNGIASAQYCGLPLYFQSMEVFWKCLGRKRFLLLLLLLLFAYWLYVYIFFIFKAFYHSFLCVWFGG